MKTNLKEGLRTHLIRKALQENQQIKEEFSDLLNETNESENGNGTTRISAQETLIRAENGVVANLFPTLLEEQCLQLPFDEGTPVRKRKAVAIHVHSTPCYRWTTSVNLNTGEINIAAVEGQLFGVAYPSSSETPYFDHSNETCGVVGKSIHLSSSYPHKVLVVATTRVLLPDNPDEVFYLEQGNLPVGIAGVQGTLINTLTGLRDGRWNSNTESEIFLRKTKFGPYTFSNIYRNELNIVNSIELGPGTNEFAYSLRAHANAHTSQRFDDVQGLDSSKYGFALVDLRNRITGNETPIAYRPFTTEFKAPPGGVKFLGACFQVFKLE